MFNLKDGELWNPSLIDQKRIATKEFFEITSEARWLFLLIVIGYVILNRSNWISLLKESYDSNSRWCTRVTKVLLNKEATIMHCSL